MINVYYRPISRWKNKPVLNRLKLHPILSEDGTYYELREDKETGKIRILSGRLEKMSERTKVFFEKPREPRRKIQVYKDKFLKAIAEFTDKYEGKDYRLSDLKTNSRGFADYVLKESRVRR